MSKFQTASMVATGALFTLQGCNDDNNGTRKSCGDFTTQGKEACVADGNGKCQWADKGKAHCEPNSKFNDFFDKSEDNCKKYGGRMEYSYKSNCGGNTLKTIDWNEAKTLTDKNEVAFLSFSPSPDLQGSLVDRCVGTIVYKGDMNNVDVEVTGGEGACQVGQHTTWTEKDFAKYKVVHSTNEKACTSNGCAVDTSNMKCVEPGVICESANQNKGKCSTKFCEMKDGGVPTCFVNEQSTMCNTVTSDQAPVYCTKTDKKQCVREGTNGHMAGECQVNLQDAGNSTCANLNADLKSQNTEDAGNICSFKASTDGECYGEL